MAKGNKSAAKMAAEQQAAAQQAPETKTQQANDPSLGTIVNNMKNGSLSQDGKAITASLVQKRWVEGENIPEGVRQGAGNIVDAFLADIIVTDIAQGSSVFYGIVARDEAKYLTIKTALAEQGISLPEFKALPAPTNEQLQKAGMKLLPGQTVDNVAVLAVPAENVDKKAVEKKKGELKVIQKAVSSPEQVENDEQLKASLAAMLIRPNATGPDGIDARVQRTINFYRTYLSIQANKMEDADKKQARLNELKAMTTVDLLKEISTIVGSCPFVIHGGSYKLRSVLAQTGNPIDPFCLYRRTAASVKNGTADDQTVADIVRTLIIWSCNGRIEDINDGIKTAERQIKKNEELAKDKDATKSKLAKAAIKTHQENIEKFKLEIAELEKLISETANPAFDVVDHLAENYNGDENSESYKLARRIVGTIMKTYYPDVDIKKADEASMLYNCQQHAGVILNMFHSPVNQNQAYSTINIGDIAMKPEDAGEEKKD